MLYFHDVSSSNPANAWVPTEDNPIELNVIGRSPLLTTVK